MIDSGVPVVIFVRKEQMPQYIKSFGGKAKIVGITGVVEIGETRQKIIQWLSLNGYEWAFMFDDDVGKVESLACVDDKWNSARLILSPEESPRVEKSALKSWFREAKAQNLSLSSPNHRAYERFHHGNHVMVNGSACIQCVLLHVPDIIAVGNYRSMYEIGNEDYYIMYKLMKAGYKTGKVCFVEYDCASVGSIEDGSDQTMEEKYNRWVKTFLENVDNDPNLIRTKKTSQGIPSITFIWKNWGKLTLDRMTRRSATSMTQKDLHSLKKACELIKSGACNRLTLDSGVLVYKVPSSNPGKYVIRVDIKVDEER